MDASFDPGAKEVITWGQYGGLIKGLDDDFLEVTARYNSRLPFSLGRRQHETRSRVDLRVFEGDSAKDGSSPTNEALHESATDIPTAESLEIFQFQPTERLRAALMIPALVLGACNPAPEDPAQVVSYRDGAEPTEPNSGERGTVKITEVLWSGSVTNSGSWDPFDIFIEIKNEGNRPANLSNWFLELEGTSIIGNRELPKILYIAPWKPPELSNLDAPRSTLLSEEITPLDRDVYQRELYYFDSFNGRP